MWKWHIGNDLSERLFMNRIFFSRLLTKIHDWKPLKINPQSKRKNASFFASRWIYWLNRFARKCKKKNSSEQSEQEKNFLSVCSNFGIYVCFLMVSCLFFSLLFLLLFSSLIYQKLNRSPHAFLSIVIETAFNSNHLSCMCACQE